MPKPKPGQTMSQFAIEQAYARGYLWHVPQNKLHLLKPDDPEVVEAMIALAKMDAASYTRNALNLTGLVPTPDEVFVPAVESMLLEEGRCPVPDIAPPPGVVFQFDDPDLQQIVLKMQRDAQMAIGGGGWANCHGGVNIHQVAIKVNPAGMNPRVVPLWPQIMRNEQRAYAGIGLLVRFIGMDNKDLLTGEDWDSGINSDLSFVSTSSGWIGLAIVGSNEGCTSRIWAKLLSSYLGGSTDESIIRQVGALLRHELGHNFYLQHTNGGIMNPSITNDSVVGEWPANDPSTPRLKSLYGGVPVPIPGGGPTPPPPVPPSTLEARVHALEVKNSVNEVTMQWCVTKIKALGG